MLPQKTRDRERRRLRGRHDDPRAALRQPRRRPLRGAAGAQRLRRAAALPLQAARPDAARPDPPRRLGARRAAGDPRSRRGRLALRPAPAGDRPHRARRRRRARARPRVRRRRLRGEAVPLPGAAGADRRGAAAPGGAARRAAAGWARSSSTRRGARPGSGRREVQLSNKEFSLLRVLAADPHRVFSKRELLGEVWGYRTPARTRTLDSHASRLRRKLDPEQGRYVDQLLGRRLQAGRRMTELAADRRRLAARRLDGGGGHRAGAARRPPARRPQRGAARAAPAAAGDRPGRRPARAGSPRRSRARCGWPRRRWSGSTARSTAASLGARREAVPVRPLLEAAVAPLAGAGAARPAARWSCAGGPGGRSSAATAPGSRRRSTT